MLPHFAPRYCMFSPTDCEGSSCCSSKSSVSSIQFARQNIESDSENCICGVSVSGSWNDSDNASPTTMMSGHNASITFSYPGAQIHQDKEFFYPNPDLLTIEDSSRKLFSSQAPSFSRTRRYKMKVSTRRNSSETMAISASVTTCLQIPAG